ncbi:MAG: inositol monophosphatase family protein [Actinomycetia bacterium]|nr:inositol monophosphatase family protein [Actinomycetes bacterium]
MSEASSPEHDITLLRSIALEVAQEAGRLVVQERPATMRVGTKSTATDVVTEMDQRAQDLIVDLLRSRRPDDGFLGEEEGERTRGSTGITWVVDPIDGTVNYLYNIPSYAVSVAAVIGDPGVEGAWSPIAGAVINPASGEAYSAGLGQGATRKDRHGQTSSLAVSTEAALSQALVATGFGYASARRAWQAAVLADLLPEVRDIRRMGSAALDLCRVAEGSVDAYYERGLNAWDLAAGWLIVTEAGGRVGDLTSAVPTSQLLIASGNAVWSSFVARLEQAMSATDVTSV